MLEHLQLGRELDVARLDPPAGSVKSIGHSEHPQNLFAYHTGERRRHNIPDLRPNVGACAPEPEVIWESL